MKTLYISLIILMLPLIGNAQDLGLDFILGQENATLIDSYMELSTDDTKVNYIENVGKRLITELDDCSYYYQFQLVEDEIPNAFSLPGGYVYITTGLLPLLQNEDELAYILAHEIIHTKNRHHVRQLDKGIMPDVVAIPGNLLTTADRRLGCLVNAPINEYEAIIFHSYGNKFEYEADIESVKLLAKAGYNPNAMGNVLNRITKVIDLEPEQLKEKSFFAAHPATEDRLRKISKTLLALDCNSILTVSDDFVAKFDGTLLGNDPNNGVLINNQYLHPIYNFSVDLPENWSAIHAKTDVGAYDKENNTAILLTLDAPEYTPQSAGELFVNRLHRRCKTKLQSAGEYSVNGKEAYKVSFECKSISGTLQASIIWVKLDGKLVRLVGVYPENMSQYIDETAQSLRSLTNNEMLSFYAKHFQVVEAQDGESLEELSCRLGNKLDLEMTGLINAKDKNELLKAGESVKIVLDVDYGFDYQDDINNNDFSHSIVSL